MVCFADRFKEALRLRNMKQADVVALTGIGKSSISTYLSGEYLPKQNNTYRIARALNVSEAWLMGHDVPMERTSSPVEVEMEPIRRAPATYAVEKRPPARVTAFPVELTKVVSVLNDKGRGELTKYGKYLSDQPEYRLAPGEEATEPERKKVIPLFYTPAAAGLASPALGEDYEDYEVPENSAADFAARIQGDSMEPYITDGSVVLVARRSWLDDGDVGLFFVDGDMKCKQYCEDSFGNIYLFSLNRRRRDADMTILASSGLTVCCFGKVLLKKRPPLPRD